MRRAIMVLLGCEMVWVKRFFLIVLVGHLFINRAYPQWTGSESANAITSQADGKILIAGSYGSPGAFSVARYENGKLDTSFGESGYAQILAGSTGNAQAVFAQENGNILAAGSFQLKGKTTPLVVRLKPNGEKDTTFGNQGILRLNTSGEATAIAIGKQQEIFVGGKATLKGNSVFLVASLSADGASETDFGLEGILLLPFPQAEAHVETIRIFDSQSIEINGYVEGNGKASLVSVFVDHKGRIKKRDSDATSL